MIGRKKSFQSIKLKLSKLDVIVRTTLFKQGKQARWGVAWSFNEFDNSANNARDFHLEIKGGRENAVAIIRKYCALLENAEISVTNDSTVIMVPFF